MQPDRARTSGLGVPLLPLARWVSWVAPVRPTHGVSVLSCPSAALRACSVLGRLAPVHRCASAVCCVASAVSWASWLLFTGVLAQCVVLRVRCPGPLGSRSSVRPLGVFCCVCGVPGHLAPVHRCACSVCCFACAVSRATWLPVHRCARSVCCVACAVSWATWLLLSGAPAGCVVVCAESWATWLLFTGAPARCVALCVRCPGPLGFLFTGVPAPWVVLFVRCPGPLGSCSPVCPLGVLCCACSVLGHLAPVHPCACSVHCVVCAVSWATWLLFSGAPAGCVVVCAESWATWLLFTGAPARCVALRVRCPGPLGSCSPGAPAGCVVVCAESWATWLLFTGAPARCVALRVRCPGPLGFLFTDVPSPWVVLGARCPGPLSSCSPVCPLGVLCCACSVLGHLAPVHRCARLVHCVVCAVSRATWLLFTCAAARCVASRVQRPGPLGSCSPVCLLRVLFCVCGVLGLVAPVHRCARSVCCVACAASWATWLLFTGAPAPSFALLVRCPGPLGFRSPVCLLGVLFCVCGVLGHLAPVHRCARSVLCFACALFCATWLLFTSVPARCVVLRVRCPGPPGSCSPVCSRGVLCCVCGVLGHLAPVHRCARSVGCVACTVSWAAWLLYTGVLALCAVLWVARVVLRGRGVAAGRSLVHPDSGCS